MDRIFLTNLVHEIEPALRGRRVRSASVDASGRVLFLSLSSPSAREFVFHTGPALPGLFLGEGGAEESSSPRSRKLTKLLAPSVVTSLEMSAVDRVVTLSLEKTRLSGKKKTFLLIFEIVANRGSLYIVDEQSVIVVECFPAKGRRLSIGERFEALVPPPHASAVVEDGDVFERRLAGESLGELLYATGWTPLLVKELRDLMSRGASARMAFETVSARLGRRRPHAYTKPQPFDVPGPIVLLSPIELEHVSGYDARPMASFNEAMVVCASMNVDTERSGAARRRIATALGRRLKALKGLEVKLRRQRENLQDALLLRRDGERILAGLGRIERAGDGKVRLPDPYDPEGKLTEMTIDPRFDLPTNADRLFKRSRKSERTRLELKTRLETVKRDIGHSEGLSMSLADATELDELLALEDELVEQGMLKRSREAARQNKRAQKLPPRKFRSARGSIILVGRSARSNEDVTFRLAKPHDLWLHANDVAGSHVVLRLVGAREASDEDVIEAAALAAYFSKARNDAYVDVMVTERQNVRKIKGAPPGLVKVSNARTVRVAPVAPAKTGPEV
ncbi:MAG: DUF814 domain-containing protein [Acidobacteria bacterium]|nr:MAG: DUF814 domain-containing protein [Acidobacteriota bacterium]